jgi:hypothetical protein
VSQVRFCLTVISASEVADGGIESWAIGTKEGVITPTSVGVRRSEDWITCRGCSCWCWRAVSAVSASERSHTLLALAHYFPTTHDYIPLRSNTLQNLSEHLPTATAHKE